jgi:hypothetical protein
MSTGDAATLRADEIVTYKRVSRAARKNSSSTGVQWSKSVPPAR